MFSAALLTLALAAPTQLAASNPFAADGAIKHGLAVDGRYHGQCYAGSSLVDGVYTCSGAHFVADPCWRDPLAKATPRFVCRYAPWGRKVSVVTVHEAPPAPKESSGGHGTWGVRLATGRHCVAVRGAADMAFGRPVRFHCRGTLRLVGEVDRREPRWRIRTVHYHRAGGYARGPWLRIAVSYYGRA
jgi:hypothetical protein